MASTAELCKSMVEENLKAPASSELERWQQVKRLQALSLYGLLRQVGRRGGVAQVERFFESTWNTPQPLGKTKGCARSLKRGAHMPTDRTLSMLDDRIGDVRPDEWRDKRPNWSLKADLFQSLWLALLVDRPIAGMEQRLLDAHPVENLGHLQAMLHTGWIGGLAETRQASLPYLSGCIVLLRHFHEANKPESAQLMAERACHSLVMLAVELHDRGIGTALTRYCSEHIFPLGGLHVDALEIAYASACLNAVGMAAWMAPDEHELTWFPRENTMASVLRGEFGEELKEICSPASTSRRRARLHRWARSAPTLRFPWRDAPKTMVVNMPKLLAYLPEFSQWILRKPGRPTARPNARVPRTWFQGLGESRIEDAAHS
ncbi:hypothetical protein FN976_11525 [Caenimonas sedimenti]|uniref:Uncharacterized protein n=1 Tax=Caenimonas sedimenti TaxID=2596921 RepID=A0A562ZTC2_9BURK|nr:hypothetical protein [Caenimonas sedimenti]TWO71535.1 hypothetical protein FN976_11525 [Caenimonas sedimenti]